MSPASSHPIVNPEPRLLMIVDDEPELLQSLVNLFERHYQVVSANSGDEALELLKNGSVPQVILSDNRMPGITGIDLLAQSTTFVPDAVRVIMTGFTDIRDILAAINQGHVYMYLTKPWQVADLLQAVRICFQHQEVQTQNKRLFVEMDRKHSLLQKVNDELYKTNKKLEESNQLYHGDLLSAARGLGRLLGMQQRYYYSNHSTDCARFARFIGQTLDFREERLNLLEMAALLHDIGILGLAHRIQGGKADTLTGKDRDLYESHVNRGAEMLRQIHQFTKSAEIVEQHHERTDGSGFPRKLRGFQILKEAQIVGLVDLYHDLVYRLDPEVYFRRALDDQLILGREELVRRQQLAGEHIRSLTNQFDPEVLTAFLSVATSGKHPELKF